MNRIGPAPLALSMPAALAAAEPSSLRRRAAEHRADADAALRQAEALRDAVVRLVPAAWLGVGSLSFAEGALLQAGNLESVAGALHELAAALDALAARLEQAQQEAAAAVRAGARLDDEVAADNALWGRRPEPERAEPDPVRLAAQVTESRLLAARLTAATESARTAWLQATAAFDLVAYRMPDLAARMSPGADDGWRPSASLTAVPAAEWRRLVGPSPVCIGAGWAGSGVLVGPDGRRYPVVVPWVERDGVRWSADLVPAVAGTGGVDTTTLDGADPGWHEVGLRVGIDTFGPAASTATKAAIVTAGFVGNAPRMVGRLRPDLLPRLQFTASGLPQLPAGTGSIPTPRVGGTGQVPRSALVADDRGQLRWVADTSIDTNLGARPAQRQRVVPPPQGKVAPVGPNVVALTGSGLAGLDTARRLDAGRLAAYRATFEENDDGRIRARLTLHQVRDDGPHTRVLSRDASVSADGALTTEPVRFRPPAAPVMSPAQEKSR